MNKRNRQFSPKPRLWTTQHGREYFVDLRAWPEEAKRLNVSLTAGPFGTGRAGRDAAEAYIDGLKVALATGELPPTESTIKDACDEWLEIAALKRKAGTIKSYRAHLNYFVRWVRDEEHIEFLDQITKELIYRYRLHVMRKLSEASQMVYLASLKLMFDHCVSAGYMQVNFVDGHVPPRPKSKRRNVTDDEWSLMREHFPEQLLAAVEFCARTGLRRKEFTDLGPDDVVLDTPRPFVRVVGGKHRSEDHVDTIPLSREAQHFARVMLTDMPKRRMRQSRERVSPYDYRRLIRYFKAECHKAGIDSGITWHNLRHDFVTRLLAAGVDMRRVQLLARHRSIKQTEAYAHDQDMHDMSPALAALDAHHVDKLSKAKRGVAVNS